MTYATFGVLVFIVVRLCTYIRKYEMDLIDVIRLASRLVSRQSTERSLDVDDE